MGPEQARQQAIRPVAITPLAPDELEQVIIAPAHAAGKEFEPGLVAEIMADASSQPGSLPLLQYAMMRAFDQSEGQLISHEDYRSVGGILGSLTQRAEEIYTDLSSSDQARTRRIIGQLVALGEGTEDTRRTALRLELGPDSEAVLDRFGAARLLTFDNDPASREPTVEVAHEALIREWPRLRVWLEEDRDGLRVERHLIVSAREWDASGRPDSELYRGGRLETAEAWAENAQPSGVPAEYLEASTALRQREIDAEAARFEAQAANNRRLRRSLAGVAVLLVCAMVAGAVAFQQRTNARTAAAEADEARVEALNAAELEQLARSTAETVALSAETGRLVATAQSLVESNKRAAMLVAVAAHQREQSASTLGGLQVALSKSGPLLGYLGWGQHYHDAHWLTENRVIGVRSDGADLFDVSTGELLDSVELEVGGETLNNYPRARNAANPATNNFVAIDRPTGAIVFRVNDRFEEIGRIESNSELQDVEWKPDGSVIVSTDTDAAISIWATDGERLFRQDMSDASTFYEQVLELVGPENAQWPGFQVPLESGVALADENGFWATWGFYLGHFSWNGQLDRTLSMWLQLPFGQFPTGVVSIATGRDSDSAHFIHLGGPKYISSLSELPDGGRIVVEQNPEFSAFDGLPSLQGVLAVADGQVLAIVDDGTIRKIDDPGGAVEILVDVAIGSSTGASMNPQDPSQVVVASPTGLVLVSLGDVGPLSRSIPRGGAPTLSITRDGRYAVTGPSGVPGPVTFWQEQAGTFVRHEATPSEPLGWAAADPGYFDVISAGGPLDGQRWLLVEDDSFRTIGQLPIYPSGEGGNAGAVDPGGTVLTAAKTDVRVHDFTSGELLRELPSPDSAGGSLAEVSGNVFHPHKPWFWSRPIAVSPNFGAARRGSKLTIPALLQPTSSSDTGEPTAPSLPAPRRPARSPSGMVKRSRSSVTWSARRELATRSAPARSCSRKTAPLSSPTSMGRAGCGTWPPASRSASRSKRPAARTPGSIGARTYSSSPAPKRTLSSGTSIWTSGPRSPAGPQGPTSPARNGCSGDPRMRSIGPSVPSSLCPNSAVTVVTPVTCTHSTSRNSPGRRYPATFTSRA